MKKYIFTLGVLLLFFAMLFFPKQVFHGASEGLLLWFQIVLPTLLPFIIVTNVLVYTNAFSYISYLLSPILKPLFGISENGVFAVIVGFFCGYPMGAKVTSDLIKTRHISTKEGAYLLSFCNNTSPMFIVSYLLWKNLQAGKLAAITLFILMSAPVICSFFFRFFYGRLYERHVYAGNLQAASPQERAHLKKFDFQVVDTSIMNSFETITKVGGYIILFSVILTLLRELPFSGPIWALGILPFIEITNGIPLICESASNFHTVYVLTLALTSFGGLCSIAQTNCMIQGTSMSILPYITEKLVTALVTSLLSIVCLYFFY